MIRFILMSRLLSLPMLWMGVIQLIFAELSHYLFQDGVTKGFLTSALITIACSLAVLFGARKYRFSSVNTKEAILFAV
ncbi:MAG: potassium transporter, partial [Marinomonas gallaica]